MKLIKKSLELCSNIYDDLKGAGDYIIRNETDYCAMYLHQKTLYVVFRGTDNREGWRSNFRCSDLNKDNVHDGFQIAYYKIEQKMFDYIKYQSSVGHVVYTGHSRGGVLAILAAYNHDFQYNVGLISCITFGAPRLGGKKWREKINRCSKFYLTRVEVPGDPVCEVPLRSMGYRKEGNILTLKTPWWWDLGTLPIIRVWKHHPNIYMKALEYTERKIKKC